MLLYSHRTQDSPSNIILYYCTKKGLILSNQSFYDTV